MAYAAPEMADIPTSPSIDERRQKEVARRKAKQSMFSNYNYPFVTRSLRWGFTVGSLYTFFALYHTNGHLYRALQHGLFGFLITVPFKYWQLMRRQKVEFFRFVQYTYVTGDETLVGVDRNTGETLGREIKYDPQKPYNEQEWEYAQGTYKKTKKSGYAGAATGMLAAIAILFVMRRNSDIRGPFFINLLFVGSCMGFGAAAAMRISLGGSITALQSWDVPGRLAQEAKQINSWMDRDAADEISRAQSKRKTSLN